MNQPDKSNPYYKPDISKIKEVKNNYQQELVIFSKDWELIEEFKNLIDEAEQINNNFEMFLPNY